MAYITATQFRLNTLLAAETLDDIEATTPGWTDNQLELASKWLDARLGKRYDVPFNSPPPTIVGDWITHIVTLNACLKRGVVATDEQFTEYKAQQQRVMDEVLEAANAETGLFDLPLRSDTNVSGVARGFPRGYSEQSPYVGFDVQATIGQQEDSNRRGTSR